MSNTGEQREVVVAVQRQAGPEATSHIDEFVVDADQCITVADALDAINARCRTRDGKAVAPVAWSASCGFPVCGSCTMRINGSAALACGSSLREAADRKGRVQLQPLKRFVLLRDLWVDRSRMRADRKRLRAWIAPGERSHDADADRALFTRCTGCGACVEACPEARAGSPFVGPAAIAAAHETRLTQPGRAPEMLEALMQRGGIEQCGRAENCLEVCPEAIPLDQALGESSRAVTRHWLRSLFSGRSGRDRS